jgi:3'(2'), 5'-bisphosphate nucleotidase
MATNGEAIPEILVQRIQDTHADLDAFTDALVETVHAAGEAVMDHYQNKPRDELVSRKADDSPLTRADLASHQAIVGALGDLLPGIPVLSEEGVAPGPEVRAGWDAFWLVDPLDGTKEFLSRNGQFTVNVALVAGGRPVVGVVHAPDLGTTYVGVLGHGAWRIDRHAGNGHGTPDDEIRAAEYKKGVLRTVVSRSHLDGTTLRFLEAIEATGTQVERVAMGSSLKLCLVAEGAAHLYPRFAPTMWWDIAAGQAVVEAAGGTVRQLDGQPLRYEGTSLRNPFFVASAQRTAAWQETLDSLEPEQLVKPRE